MNQLKVFESPEFGLIRTIEINGKTWFVGKDIAVALGYDQPHKAVARHCKHGTKRTVPHPQSPDKLIEVLCIPEGDVYRLIAHSKLPSAEEFESWVFDEVLPSISKHGGYMMGQEEWTREELLAKSLIYANSVMEERAARIEELEAETQAQAEQIALAEPKVEYYDYFVDNRCTTSLTDTGKQIGMKPRAFIDWLIDKKYIFRKGKELLPYSQYTNKYFIVRDFATNRYIGRQTYVTEKGKVHFRKLCQKEGLIPPDQEIVTMVQPSDTFIM